MKLGPIAAAAFALFVVSSPQVALADPPPTTKPFTIPFDGDAAIWNPFEGFQACETLDDLDVSGTMCLTLDDVSCDGAGDCTCDARLEFSGDIDGLLTGPGSCTTSASCKATPENPSDAVCKAKLAFDASGSFSALGVSCEAKVSNFVVNGPVDSTGFYSGKAKTKLCIECSANGRTVKDCGGLAGLFEYPVNPPSPWELTVQLSAPDSRKPNNLQGEGFDDLGFEYTAKGKYNPKTDQSTLTLTGDPASISQGAKIKLEELDCDGDGCSDGTATFKVQGNSAKDAPVGP